MPTSLYDGLGLTPASIAVLLAPYVLGIVLPPLWSRWKRRRAIRVQVLSDEAAYGRSEPSTKR